MRHWPAIAAAFATALLLVASATVDGDQGPSSGDGAENPPPPAGIYTVTDVELCGMPVGLIVVGPDAEGRVIQGLASGGKRRRARSRILPYAKQPISTWELSKDNAELEAMCDQIREGIEGDVVDPSSIPAGCVGPPGACARPRTADDAGPHLRRAPIDEGDVTSI